LHSAEFENKCVKSCCGSDFPAVVLVDKSNKNKTSTYETDSNSITKVFPKSTL
jgi:hypothetical protein